MTKKLLVGCGRNGGAALAVRFARLFSLERPYYHSADIEDSCEENDANDDLLNHDYKDMTMH
jgi:hypothetical protein